MPWGMQHFGMLTPRPLLTTTTKVPGCDLSKTCLPHSTSGHQMKKLQVSHGKGFSWSSGAEQGGVFSFAVKA